MKKSVLITIIVTVVLTLAIGIAAIVVVVNTYGNNASNTNEGSNNSSNYTQTSNVKKPDHKIYKYMKMTSDNLSTLLYSGGALFNSPSTVANGDIYYKPCIIAQFDTETGKATKATLYAFFLDGEDNEWVNKAIEKYNSSTSESKKYYTNVKKGRVNDNVSYLSADIDINCYQFTQFIDSYIIKAQDINKYKDEIYYSRLYNYSSTPPHEEGSNFFEESLEGIRIEWSDTEIKPFVSTNTTTNATNTTDTTNTTDFNTATNTIKSTIKSTIANTITDISGSITNSIMQ